MNETGPVTAIHFVRTFPWLRLGRAIGCALSPTQLVLAVAGVLVMTLLQDLLIARVIFETNTLDGIWYEVTSALETETATAEPAHFSPPLGHVAGAFQEGLSPHPGRWKLAIIAVSAFTLWTILGVAIARSTAVQFCRDTGPSFRSCLQWSLSRIVNSLTAIVTPLCGTLVLGIAILVITLPGILPGLGTMWLHLAAPVLTLLAFVGGAILAMLPFLWPLMVAAVAVDGSDSFDAFSRSFSLVTSRFWSAVGLIGLGVLTTRVLSWLLNHVDSSVAVMVNQFALIVLGAKGDWMLMSAISWWLDIFKQGILASYFWSVATIIYLLLRHMVDGTPLDNLAGYDDDMRFHEPFPVVGIAGATNTANEQP
ncbi:hypothetical protein GC163_09110 [bacterium]|nr:hypothetical protein [bacterium]